VEMRLDRSRRGPRDLRDLAAAEAVDVVEDERVPRPIRERGDRPLEVDPRLRLDTGRSSRPPIHLGPVIEAGPAARLRSLAIPDYVERDAVEPGGEGGIAPVGADARPDPDEHVLRQLGRAVGTAQPQAERVDLPDVSTVELLVGGRVPGLASPNQLGRPGFPLALSFDRRGDGKHCAFRSGSSRPLPHRTLKPSNWFNGGGA